MTRAIFLGVAVAAVLVAGLFVLFGRQPSAGTDDVLRPVDPSSVYDPIVGGEAFPGGIRWVISRDGIHPIYDPTYVTADLVKWDDGDLVIGLEIDGEARAYPIGYLSRREMVNDTVASVPILVAWCPLCGTATVHRREVDGEPVLFGNQGALWGNAMTWWDHETGSIWSQPLGEAIAGPLKGRTLELLPSTLTTWVSWRDAHLDTLALSTPTDRSALQLDSTAIVLDSGVLGLGNDATAYPVQAVREAGVVNDVVAGLEVAVLVDPTDEDRWAVFSRRLNDQVITLSVQGDAVTDVETGSVWDVATGRAISGPLAGEVLEPLPASTVFPKDFLTFWPNGTLWEPNRARE